jgi:fucose permease
MTLIIFSISLCILCISRIYIHYYNILILPFIFSLFITISFGIILRLNLTIEEAWYLYLQHLKP